jgi:hypothetical protein
MAARKSKTAPVEKPKYKPTPRDVAAVKKFLREQEQQAPRLKVSKSGDVLKIRPDHPNKTAGQVLLMEALATTDLDFLMGFVTQLASASGGEVDEARLNFMLAVVNDERLIKSASISSKGYTETPSGPRTTCGRMKTKSPAVAMLPLDRPRSLLIDRTTSHAPLSALPTCRPIPSTG